MAGHSQFKNIMYRKGAQDARRAKIFTKLIRELTVATREGLPNPNANPRLRTAVTAARAANMPRDTMERAIKRGSGDAGGVAFEQVRYEGYGPGSIALIVDTLTDNRNRTAAAVRSAFNKYGGAMGETNTVAFQFNRMGFFRYPLDVASEEEMMDVALEAGADDVVTNGQGHEITCSPDDFHVVLTGLDEKFGTPGAAELLWRPLSTVTVDEDAATTLFKLIEALEDDDDVQSVSSNFDISDEIMGKLNAS
jgi:YebC/PmpR family DNA-binding regulatory protein